MIANENKEWVTCKNPQCKKPKHKSRMCACGWVDKEDLKDE